MSQNKHTLNNQAQLNIFLGNTERKAFVMAVMATKNRDDALDIVQDAMLSFAKRYAGKPEVDWPPLFYRVLQNQIRDWYRRQQVRNAFEWFSASNDPEHQVIPSESVTVTDDPVYHLQQEGLRNDILKAVSSLSLRQQQVFLLRIWEGLSVRDTAAVMQCSQGSVKTHLFRATEQLKQRLEKE